MLPVGWLPTTVSPRLPDRDQEKGLSRQASRTTTLSAFRDCWSVSSTDWAASALVLRKGSEAIRASEGTR